MRAKAADKHSRADGYRKPDTYKKILFRRVGQGGYNAHNMSLPVEQGATRTAGIDGRVELDQPLSSPIVAVHRDRTVETRDHPCTQRSHQPQGIADHIGFISNPHRPQIPENGREDPPWWLVRT